MFSQCIYVLQRRTPRRARKKKSPLNCSRRQLRDGKEDCVSRGEGVGSVFEMYICSGWCIEGRGMYGKRDARVVVVVVVVIYGLFDGYLD